MNAQLINTPVVRTIAGRQVVALGSYTTEGMREHATKMFTALQSAEEMGGIHPVDVELDRVHNLVKITLNQPVNGDTVMTVSPVLDASIGSHSTKEEFLAGLLLRISGAGMVATIGNDMALPLGNAKGTKEFPNKTELDAKMHQALTELVTELTLRTLGK